MGDTYSEVIVMEDNNQNGKKNAFAEFISRYGTYAIVILCIVCVALASVFLVPRDGDETARGSDSTDAGGAEGNDTVADIKDEKPVSQSRDESLNDMLSPLTGEVMNEGGLRVPNTDVSSTPIPDFTPSPDKTQTQTELLSAPVDGEIIWAYAMNELIYSQTLDQWTTHCGVDIACKEGDNVRAVADGTVEKVYNDDAYGLTVVIRHKNGHKSVYSNLAEGKKTVTEGKDVKASDVIGISGNTAQLECADKSHIHFEYHVDDKPVNPEKYVRFKKNK